MFKCHRQKFASLKHGIKRYGGFEFINYLVSMNKLRTINFIINKHIYASSKETLTKLTWLRQVYLQYNNFAEEVMEEEAFLGMRFLKESCSKTMILNGVLSDGSKKAL